MKNGVTPFVNKFLYLKLLVSLFLTILISATARSQEAPVLLFHFDKGSGNQATDSSGNNNHGTINGATWTSESVSGNALEFDGNSYVNVSDSLSMDFNKSEGSIELWVKPVTPAIGKYQLLVIDQDFEIEFNMQDDGDLFYYPWVDGSFQNFNLVTNPLTAGEWQHVVVTWKFSTQEVRIYINGVNQTLAIENVPIYWTTLASTADWHIGGSPVKNQYFNGIIDEVKIYDQALSVEEILEHYHDSTLTWISIFTPNIKTGTRNNLVGQINFPVGGWSDYLQAFTAENLGTAKANEDISALWLWYMVGGGGGGTTFDPLKVQSLGKFENMGEKIWKIILTPEVELKSDDALYITADIGRDAQIGRTCRFSLPTEGAEFKSGNKLPVFLTLTNSMEQVILGKAFLSLDFISVVPTNVVQGQKAVRLGQIKLNVSIGSIDIYSLLLGLQDRSGNEQGLGTVFERIWIEQDGNVLSQLVSPFTDNMLTFSPLFCLYSQSEEILALAGDIKEKPEVKEFVIGLPHAQCINGGSLLAESVSGKMFPLLSGQVNIRVPELKATFRNYPNPFQIGREVTRISYYLEREASVRIEIRTLTGELVKKIEDLAKSQGIHEKSWDGKNAQGNGVRSGVYFLCLEVEYKDGGREKLTRKLAVVR